MTPDDQQLIDRAVSAWDLRHWLFRWGAGIRIEQPLALRELQLQQAREVVALLQG